MKLRFRKEIHGEGRKIVGVFKKDLFLRYDMVLLNIHLFSLSSNYSKKTCGEHEDKHWQH